MNTKKKSYSVFAIMTFSILLSGGLFPFMEAQAGGVPVVTPFEVEPSGEPAFEFQGHCYAFIPPQILWTDAFADAQTKSVNGNQGHLVSITSAAEQAHVDSVSALKGWIGYTSDVNFPQGTLDANNYGWITGEPAGFTNWNGGEPNNANELYVEDHQGGQQDWNDAFNNSPVSGYFVEFDSCIAVVGGEFLPIDSTALVLAGLQTSAIWMLPVLAGVAGSAFGILYIKSRRN